MRSQRNKGDNLLVTGGWWKEHLAPHSLKGLRKKIISLNRASLGWIPLMLAICQYHQWELSYLFGEQNPCFLRRPVNIMFLIWSFTSMTEIPYILASSVIDLQQNENDMSMFLKVTTVLSLRFTYTLHLFAITYSVFESKCLTSVLV